MKDLPFKDAPDITAIWYPEPVLFFTDSLASADKKQLADEAPVHLRRAASAQKTKIYSGRRNKSYCWLLLRPLLIPGTKADANAYAIR
jgi:hypothetical protein